MQKVVAVFSGGMDSTTLVYELRTHYDVSLLSFNYGQRHVKELLYAKATAQRLNLPHEIVDLTSATPLLKGSSLTSDAIAVPDGHYTHESMRITVVPNRNAIMLSLAWAYATSIEAIGVVTAVHAGDHAIYPDCRPEFITALATAFRFGTESYSACKGILAPFILWDKAMIVLLGAELKVPYDQTWSCYKGGPLHCGTCGTCVERREAFQLAKVDDPTTYVNLA